MNTSSLLAGLAFVSLLGGCASHYGPGGLAAGADEGQVVARMGPPTARYPRPEGGQRLEYQRGPAGLDTYMLDLDAQGRVVAVDQVLDSAHFERIRPGQTRDQVLYAIGHPGYALFIGWQKRDLWHYRYKAPVCQLFQVSFDGSGRAVEAGYGRDPTCDPDKD